MSAVIEDAQEDFAACVAYVLGIDPADVAVGADSDAASAWRAWLAPRGLGLVPIRDPGEFALPGYWIAIGRGGDGRRSAVVMFGVPSGPVFSPRGEAAEIAVEAGFALVSLDLREPAAGAPSPGRGRVEGIYVAQAAEAPMRPVDRAFATAAGIVGDRYHGGVGTFSRPGGSGQALTLIEAEAIETVASSGGPVIAPADARRNVVTRGIRLNALVGRTFRVGGVRCAGRRLCEPCTVMQRLTRPGVLRAYVHRGGLRADVLAEGEIEVGSAVTPDG